MKIYNKRGFASGIFTMMLGVVNLILDVVHNKVGVKGSILIVALLCLGFHLVFRSLSYKCSMEDKMEELDERNQLVKLKSKSKSFSLVQIISFILMTMLLVIGKIKNVDVLLGIGVGIGFILGISMFAELFTFIYYEHKN